MTERRFTDDEVAAIFARAVHAERSAPAAVSSAEGLTLAQIQEIGREVGIAPEVVADAAASIGTVGVPTARRFLGLPLGVGRTVDLGRRLTDAEWERFVVDLRETFDARGVMRQEGSFRQWTNGNLQALLEPTPGGQRLRLRTLKSDARALMMAGLAMLGIAGAVGLATLLRLGTDANLSPLVSLVVMGGGIFSLGAIRLPGWARTRRRQMEELTRRLLASSESRG